MGIFGKDFESKETSKVSDGGKRVTTHYDDGSSEDETYNSYGRLVDITDHEKDGSSHSHDVIHGFFGPSKGCKK